ncbi:MAG: serine/threonine protein kinase [Planctomycetes bacterium]|nr:serine/threonine protein kinase [Planctomycetota bacterium]
MSQPNDNSASSPGDPDLSGRLLGDYRLLRRIGRGAMAEVYLAEQLSLQRQVAVKVLRQELAGKRTLVERFRREAQAAAALVHANIVQIHDVGQIDGIHLIVQEYVQGHNLSEWIARNGTPDTATAVAMIRQVAAALVKAAEHDIVHRDIKPENILVTAKGEVKVADFGLARVARQEGKLELTQVGLTVGTPLYMSPEQVEGQSLDPRSDIYSLGVTCYHLLTGRPPFEGETALSVAVKHLNKNAKPLADLRPDLPDALCRIVHKMLAKKPAGRYPSAAALVRDLRQFATDPSREPWPDDSIEGHARLAGESGELRNKTTRRLAAVMDTARLESLRTRRHVALLAIGVVAAMLAGAVLGYTTTQDGPLLPSEVPQTPPFPRRDTVFRQWFDAAERDTEEAWQAVIDYFPDQPYYVHRAKQQLARIYLQRRDDRRAMELFEELARLGDDEPGLRAFGLAGECGILTLHGDYARCGALLEELYPIRGQLDPRMEETLAYVIRENQKALAAGSSKAADSPNYHQWQEIVERFDRPVDNRQNPE